MKNKFEKLIGERITHLELKGSGACNNAYYIETSSGNKYIVKEEKPNQEFIPQNTLIEEANIIQQLSKLNLKLPIPKIAFISKRPDTFCYSFIEGRALINVWQEFSEKEKIGICQDLGAFHAEIGQKVTKELAENIGIHINYSARLHPEVEKEYLEILNLKDIPTEFIELAQKAKTLFDQTLDMGVFQFIHNDSHHENILIKDKKISAIIDFGESEYGEIAKEFSRYIRDYPDYFEHIVLSYEKKSGNKLSRKRLISNAFLSGLIDNVIDYRKGSEDRLKSKQAIIRYKEFLREF